jgi:uncharacterized membrane protein YeaQ/YmgE (transglycosylase-associated protein family)
MARDLRRAAGTPGDRRVQAFPHAPGEPSGAPGTTIRNLKELLMHLIAFLLFGLVVGVLARLIVPGREPGGWVISMLLGVAGAFLGGFLGRGLGLYREGEPAGFVMSLIGAIILVVAYHAMARRRALV